MLHLLRGPDHKVNTEAVMQKIVHLTGNGTEGLILIVPEQYSFDTERLLCEAGGDQVSRYAEVLSFSRLAGRVESLYGGSGRLWLDRGGRLLSAAQAVEQVSSRIKLYASVCRRPEFLEMFLATVDEFGSYGVTSGDLIAASERFEGQFAQKLTELGLLYESYLAVCAHTEEPSMRLGYLAEALCEAPFGEGRRFFIDGFADFSAVEAKIIEELIASAEDVTIALPYQADGGAFLSADAAAKRFTAYAEENGCGTETESLGYAPQTSVDLRLLQQSLTVAELPAYDEPTPNLRVAEYPSEEDECRGAVREIRRLTAAGVRYRDIAVACARADMVQGALRDTLSAAQIPCFISGSHPVTDTGPAKMLLCALRAVSGGMQRDDVADYLKCGFTALSADEVDRLVNYAFVWNLNHGGWQKQWTLHPDGLDAHWRDGDEARLSELNAFRDRGLNELFALDGALSAAGNVSAMARAIYVFTQDIRLRDTLQWQSDALYASGDHQSAQELAQVYETLIGALEQMAMVLGDLTRSVEELGSLLRKLLDQYSVSSVPACIDQVTVGELAAFRHRSVKHLIVIGAADGSMPCGAAAGGIFTEEERKTLLGAGLSMAPLRSDQIDRELGSIYAVLRSASQSLCLSCGGKEPSYIFTRIKSIFPQSVQKSAERVYLNDGEEAAAFARCNADAVPIPTRLREKTQWLLDGAHHSFGTILPEHIHSLYGRELNLSPSQIDKFVSCRFGYFLNYGLHAREIREASVDASTFGTFVHDILEHTARDVMARGGFHSVSEADTLTIAEAHMEDYLKTKFSGLAEQGDRFRVGFERNKEETRWVIRDLWRELSRSEFIPAAFELSFAEGGDMPPIRAAGENASCSVNGRVDRTDLFKCGDVTYVRVIDYKTGKKDFDYTDVETGAGMQMLIYLFALRQGGEACFGTSLQPAGVLYFPARQAIVSVSRRPTEEAAEAARAKDHKRKGILLDDEIVLRAMEDYGEKPEYLPFTAKAGKSRAGDLANLEQMQMLRRHVSRKLGEIADGICSGCVEPNPIVRGEMSSCRYCDFSEICQKDLGGQQERRLKSLRRDEFFEELQKREAEHHD